jgi:CDP-diacylglycerol---serine O-phosphatidyltransferase
MAAMNAIKYLVPNGFTATSMLFGLASVVASAQGQFELAAWMILWGVLLDKLDGASARLLRASSEFGVQFDSFADFVIFGIAPAALCYFSLRSTATYESGFAHGALLGVSGLYAVATSARLARFNISEPPGGENIFFGIPTTLVGALIASGYLTWLQYGLDASYLLAFPAILGVLGVSMVSNLRIPKLKARKNPILHWFQILNLVAVYVVTPLRLLPEYLLILCLVYLVVGLTWGALNPLEDVTKPEEQPA